ncbi:MAG: ABC transporter permease [Deltaproteobacteria bacterium]|nr:ABC transporter permease [Deltaproteobacteria bacterium]
MSNERDPHPLVELTKARILEMVREPGVMFWVFGFPIVLAIGLGLAFREQGPEKSIVAVVTDDRTQARVAPILLTSDGIVAQFMSSESANDSLERAKVDLVVELRAKTSSGAPSATFRFDPRQPKSLVARLSTSEGLERAYGRDSVVSKSNVEVTEHGQRYVDFLLPGLLGLNLMGSSMWGIGYAIVETRSRRLMKRFAATPMYRPHYLLSYIFSRVLILFAELVVLFVFGLVAFDVQIRGSIPSLVAVALGGSLSFAGVALAIAARPSKTEVASGWMNAVMMPMWILSGSFFSYERFPEWLVPLIRALPLTALNDGLRLIVNEGASIFSTGAQLLVLGLWGVVGFAFALRNFKWS